MKSSLKFLILTPVLFFCFIMGYMLYYLPSDLARLFMLLSFFIPILLVAYYVSTSFIDRKTKIFVALAFLTVTSLVFMTHNFGRIPTLLDGYEVSETRNLADAYREQGTISFPDSHSYFFQTSFLLYCISSVCSVSTVYASIAIMVLYIVVVAIVSLYVAANILKNVTSNRLSFIPFLATFSLFSSANMMFTNVAYRYLASPLFLVLLFFYYNKSASGRRSSRAVPIVALILIIGITLGDPTTAILMIPFFLIVSFLQRNPFYSALAVIPLAYFSYSATSYLNSIKTYTVFSLEGLASVLQDLFTFKFSERILPWHRVTSLPAQDSYIVSAAYLSLLALSALVGIVSGVLWMRKRLGEDGGEKAAFAKASCLVLLGMTAIGTFTYVGASVRPEVSFSDIRTIVMLFLPMLLLFSFSSKVLLSKLTRNKYFLATILIMLVFLSLRVIYATYPKSSDDPIRVVEDGRLGSTSIYVVATFVNDYYKKGGIVGDYKTFNRIGEFLPSPPYEKQYLNATTLSNPFGRFPYRSLVIFNTAGTAYPSIYHSPEAYLAAFNFSVTHNRLYDNGQVVIASHER